MWYVYTRARNKCAFVSTTRRLVALDRDSSKDQARTSQYPHPLRNQPPNGAPPDSKALPPARPLIRLDDSSVLYDKHYLICREPLDWLPREASGVPNEDAMGEKEFLTRLGFQANPFQFTNADEEDHLQSYFVPPPL
jgi:hypothetical protein